MSGDDPRDGEAPGARASRRWRRDAMATAAAAVALLAAAAQTPSLAQAPRTVAAQRFVLLSPGGQGTGATPEFTARGPELTLFDPGSKPRLRVGLDEAGPGVDLLDENRRRVFAAP
jgi:hypothetical protein